MSARERAAADIERGDLGSARRRLSSLLQTRGYDAALLTELARLCARMGDRWSAGRYWLLSDDDGPEAEHGIATFLAGTGGKPSVVVAQLPSGMRHLPPDRLAPVARVRAEKLGLLEAMRVAAPPPAPPRPFREKLAAIGCLVVLLFSGAMMLVGLETVVRFLRRH